MGLEAGARGRAVGVGREGGEGGGGSGELGAWGLGRWMWREGRQAWGRWRARVTEERQGRLEMGRLAGVAWDRQHHHRYRPH